MSSKARYGFIDLVMELLSMPEYVKNWERLRGMRFPRNPMERMVDQSSGYGEAVMLQFIEDAAETIWLRLPDDAFEGKV